MRWQILVVVVMGVLASVSSARAQSLYAAIAFSASDGRYGSWWQAPSENDALTGAVSNCQTNGGTSCQAIVWVQDGCAALAVGYNSYGGGWSAVQQYNWVAAETRAGDFAMQECQSRTGQCQIAEYICSGAPTHIPPQLQGGGRGGA